MGILDSLIGRHRKRLLKAFREYDPRTNCAGYGGPARLFDNIRMANHGLHHSRAYLKVIQARTYSNIQPEGKQ